MRRRRQRWRIWVIWVDQLDFRGETDRTGSRSEIFGSGERCRNSCCWGQEAEQMEPPAKKGWSSGQIQEVGWKERWMKLRKQVVILIGFHEQKGQWQRSKQDHQESTCWQRYKCERFYQPVSVRLREVLIERKIPEMTEGRRRGVLCLLLVLNWQLRQDQLHWWLFLEQGSHVQCAFCFFDIQNTQFCSTSFPILSSATKIPQLNVRNQLEIHSVSKTDRISILPNNIGVH